MLLKPIGNRVLAKRKSTEVKSNGGILLPEESRKPSYEAEIIAVGEGNRNEDGSYTPLEVKPGDIVIFSKHCGTPVKIDGESYFIFEEKELLGIKNN